MQSLSPRSRAFTLIEVLLYVALSAAVSLVILSVTWNVIRLGEESFWYQAGATELARASERINSLIRNADSVELVSADTLRIGLPDTSATADIHIVSGSVVIDTDTPIALTGDAATVTGLQFSVASPEHSNATMISYILTANTGFLGGLRTLSFGSGAEARSLFVQE
ncbi:MAG: type II secretion system protein J [Undibacterium sp.]